MDVMVKHVLKIAVLLGPVTTFAYKHALMSPADRKRCDATKAQVREITKRTVELGKDIDTACEGDYLHQGKNCKDSVQRQIVFLHGSNARMKSLLASAPLGCNQEKLGPVASTADRKPDESRNAATSSRERLKVDDAALQIPSRSHLRHAYAIQTKYDKFKDGTTVTLGPVKLKYTDSAILIPRI
jgi:hypothetical protein